MHFGLSRGDNFGDRIDIDSETVIWWDRRLQIKILRGRPGLFRLSIRNLPLTHTPVIFANSLNSLFCDDISI